MWQVYRPTPCAASSARARLVATVSGLVVAEDALAYGEGALEEGAGGGPVALGVELERRMVAVVWWSSPALDRPHPARRARSGRRWAGSGEMAGARRANLAESGPVARPFLP